MIALASPAFAQDRTADVKAIATELWAAGIDTAHGPGECGRFELVKRFVWRYRHEGWGLIAKFGAQNGCSAANTLSEPKYAVDAILNRITGQAVDISGAGADGPNTPHWDTSITADPSLWREPFDPGPLPGPVPVPVPTPTPQPPPYDWQSWVSQTLLRIETKQDAGFATMQREHLEIRAAVDRPGWLERIVKHPIFVAGSSLIAGYLTKLAVDK